MRGLLLGAACILTAALFSGCLSSRPSKKAPPDLRHLLQPADGGVFTNYVSHADGITPSGQEALMRGLAWLKTNQREDGSWESSDPLAVTAMGLLSLAVDIDPAFSKSAADYLRAQQREDGWWGEGSPPDPVAHALCTWALAEYGLRSGVSGDREALERAGRQILARRHERGGWNDGYGALGRMGNSEISALQLLALHALYSRGFLQEALRPAFEAGALHLVEFQDPASGRFGHRFRGVGSPGSAAMCLLALQRTGYAKSLATRMGVVSLREDLQRNVRSGDSPLLAAWFMALAGATEGAPLAGEMERRLAERLLPRQQPDGSWPPAGKESAFGPAFSTALCTLILQAGQTCVVPGRIHPPIWEISNAGRKARVLGTAPVMEFDLPLLHGKLWACLEASASLIGEVDWRQCMQAIQSGTQVAEKPAGMDPALLRTAGQQLGLGPLAGRLADYPGWAVSLAVLSHALKDIVPEEGPEIEAYLHRGLAGIRRSSLLTADAYASSLQGLTLREQDQLLRAALEHAASFEAVVAAGNRAWRGGGLEPLEGALTGLKQDPGWLPFYDRYMVAWNSALSASTAQALQEQEKVLLVLPLIRLVGPDGLLTLWAEKGFEIKRLDLKSE